MRKPVALTVEGVIRDAIAVVVQRAAASIQKAIAAEVAAEVKAAKRSKPASAPRRAARKVRRAARGEMTKWVADNRARRVPNFVIEVTGLDTKKKIVAKFGPNVIFEKGKPLPVVRADAKKNASRVAASKAPRNVKAKPPAVRKAAAVK
jgi:hypothetical protein